MISVYTTSWKESEFCIMAELVHFRLELTLPELEEILRIGLFNKVEIRSMIKRRKHFEYKLHHSPQRKEDILQYIEYETNLLNLIEKKRKRLLLDAKKKEIDGSIARRIKKFFRLAVSRFPEDEKLWLDYIQFSKSRGWVDTISSLQTQLLHVHSKNPTLSIMAAKWEMEEMKSPDNARKILQRSLLLNPRSTNLWHEYFRMELMYTDLIGKRRAVLEPQNWKSMDTEEEDVILSGKIANIVYDQAVEAINDVEFALSFIQICSDFEFGNRHIEYIFEDVSEKFSKEEEALDALAKKPLIYVEERIKKGKEMGFKKKGIIDEIFNEIHAKYREATEAVPTEKMWGFYIDFVLNIMNSAKESKKAKLRNMVINIMKAAAAVNCLDASNYSELVDLLFERGDTDEALSTSLVFARKWNTVDLWYKCLTYHIQCLRDSAEIYAFLQEAVNTVNEKDSGTLWKLGVEWLSISSHEKLIEFFESGITRCKEISVPLKEMYLETVALKDGVTEARSLYKRYKEMGPLTPPIVKKMIKIEKAQLDAPIKTLRQYFEDGIREFGSEDVDIWLEYLKLEISVSGGGPALYNVLHWRAKKILKPVYLNEFQRRVVNASFSDELLS
ncbi:u3 small nucleolar RNA-associated protein 6 homolog [Nephila pilipes]|uniref:U3 small nucleolar RNA-associated protein 6 homolog n=1 Tax=Nephila pilipes TaxID=299642 RepID=A0A8X6TEU6_NEPPI|nr:u3 small nucleolar RNA-associated protein 6 homolog [Nephila pilipes]